MTESVPAESMPLWMLADYVEDRGQTLLAEGYRLIDSIGLSPWENTNGGTEDWYWWWNDFRNGKDEWLKIIGQHLDYPHGEVPGPWWMKLKLDGGDSWGNHAKLWPTRWEAIRALADAWTRVPERSREKIKREVRKFLKTKGTL